ncbi:MAG: hypothetical protein HYW97_00175 [Candidatus Wildermuthbacteria bacterium]|nr:hypothetical protein [Candidatus Wildermuthbacteria bacterium]
MTIRLVDARGMVEKSGGKAVRLSAMIDARLPVKDGVVITTDEVATILATGRVPQCMLDEINEAVKFPVAIRSSAIGEDGNLTWAGQFTTQLSVSLDAVEDAILDCARALRSDAVRAYAQSHEATLPELALIVQEMVSAQVAGVLFTRHPVNGRGTVVIEAVEGLGDMLVSGKREPRRFYVNPVSKKVVEVEGADKPALSHAQIKELVRRGNELKTLFGKDQDVEWAVDGSGQVFFLQSRDITALGQKDGPAHVGTSLGEVLQYESARLRTLGASVADDVLSDQNIAEILTPHPSRMAFGLFTYVFGHGDGAIRIGRNEMGYEIGHELDIGFFHLVAGQPRCSIVHDAFTYRVQGIPLSDYVCMVEHYLERIGQDSRLANYPEVVLYNQNPDFDFLSSIFGQGKARRYRQAYARFFRGFQILEDNLAVSCRKEFVQKWRQQIRRQSQLDGLSLSELCEHYQRVADLLRTEACVMFVKAARVGFFSYTRLRNLLKELFGEDSQQYLDILTSGTPLTENPNLRFSIELARMKQGVRSEKMILKQFGHLAIHELEISVPRYWEEPARLRALANGISENPEATLKESARRSKRLETALLERAGKRRAELHRGIRMARTYLPLRELVKFEFLRGYDVLRQIALRINDMLGWEKDSIFQLDPYEVIGLPRNVDRFAELAAERRQQFNEHQKVFVPTVIFSNRLEEIGEHPSLVDGDRVFYGVGVTNKSAEGTAVVMHSLDDGDAIAALHPGSILVTITTDPAWSPMLSIVGPKGALVTEIGGLLAHGAIYAREVGMAAVLNIPNITKALHTGMRVRVNGQNGSVEILD